MACYFIVDTYIDGGTGRGLYDEYIREVKPIVEGFGGEYLVRTDVPHSGLMIFVRTIHMECMIR